MRPTKTSPMILPPTGPRWRPARSSALVTVMLMDQRVATAAGDQIAVRQKRERVRDRKAGGDADVEDQISEASVHRAWPHDHGEVVDRLHDRDRKRVDGQRGRDNDPGGQARTNQRYRGEAEAEEIGECDGERDLGAVPPTDRGSDCHPRDLADRAAR